MGKRREGDLGQVSSRTEKLSGSKKKKKKLPADKLFKKKKRTLRVYESHVRIKITTKRKNKEKKKIAKE